MGQITSAMLLAACIVLGLDPYRFIGPDHVLARCARSRLRTRGRIKYSNLGAALCGQLSARRAGLDYPELVRARLCTPLGLASTSASPQTPRPTGRSRWGLWLQPWRPNGFAPAGGATSTLADLVDLTTAVIDNTAPGQGACAGEGLFWQVHHTADEARRHVWHNGQTGGYAAYLAVYPERGMGVVVLAARSNAAWVGRLADACVRVVLDEAP